MSNLTPDDLRRKTVHDRDGVAVGVIALAIQDPVTRTVRSAQMKIDGGLKARCADINKEIVNLDISTITIDPATKEVRLTKSLEELRPQWR